MCGVGEGRERGGVGVCCMQYVKKAKNVFVDVVLAFSIFPSALMIVL